MNGNDKIMVGKIMFSEFDAVSHDFTLHDFVIGPQPPVSALAG